MLMLMLCGVGAFAQPLSIEKTAVAQAPSAHDDTSSHHKCCHSSLAPNFEIAQSLPPLSTPCGSEHPCCVRPGPANVAEMPSVQGQQRPDTGQRGIGAPSNGATILLVTAALRGISLLPYGTLSTVLRI
jgi:hypothetical protein